MLELQASPHNNLRILPETPAKNTPHLEFRGGMEFPQATPTASQETKKGFLQKFLSDAEYRTLSLSSINAVLHALATITSFGPQAKGFAWLGSINKLFDKAAFTCTRWIAPIISYGFASYKALLNKEGLKAFVKLIPPIFLPMVGDANIDTVYGTSAAINQPYDLIEERIKFLVEQNPEMASMVKNCNKTFSGNFKLMAGIGKLMFKEFFQGRMPKEEFIFFLNCFMILGGSIPLIMFDRHSRSSGFAKAMGLLRNVGGILGDIGLFWFDRENMHKFMVSIMCGTSALGSILKRWVKSDAIARTLIHLSAALDVSAYAFWNAYNDKSQDKLSRHVKPELVQSKLAQLDDTKQLIHSVAKTIAV